MRVYIKEWPNRTASIITAEGQVIWTFSSSETARQACREWGSLLSPDDVECYDSAAADSARYSCLA
jgi:hypothetical protein